MEVWKDVPNNEGLYQVSSVGRVKSLNYHREKIEKMLSPCKNSDGYFVVLLYKNGRRKTCPVHRIVAEAFLSNEKNLPCINHKDENKENNAVENLEYCSVAYNNIYGTRMKRAAIANGKKVLCLELSKVFDSAGEAARSIGGSQSAITRVCQGHRKSAYSYHWEYAP